MSNYMAKAAVEIFDKLMESADAVLVKDEHLLLNFPDGSIMMMRFEGDSLEVRHISPEEVDETLNELMPRH